MARDGDWLPTALVFAQPLALTTEPQPGDARPAALRPQSSFLPGTGKNASSAGPAKPSPSGHWPRGLQEQAERLVPGQRPKRKRPGVGGEGGEPGHRSLAAWEDAVCAREAVCAHGWCAWPLMCPLQRPRFPELCSPRVMNLRAGSPGRPVPTAGFAEETRLREGRGRGAVNR